MRKIELSEEFIKREYLVNFKTFEQIASICGCSKRTIIDFARKNGIPARTTGQRRKDLQGKIIGDITKGYFITVKEPLLKTEKGKTRLYWLCTCSCGEDVLRTYSSLKSKRICMCWSCRNQYISLIKWKGFGEISGEFWDRVKHSAKVRDFSFDLTIQDAWKLFLNQNRKCALSGKEIIFNQRGKDISEATASLDRIDSLKGYSINNVQWVHKILNNLKMDLPQSEFVEWCHAIANKHPI